MYEIEMPRADHYESHEAAGQLWGWADASNYASVMLHLFADNDHYRLVFMFGVHEDDSVQVIQERKTFVAGPDLRALPLIIEAVRQEPCVVCGKPFKALECECPTCDSETCHVCDAWGRSLGVRV